MNLKYTKQLLDNKYKNKDFDTYAVLVHYGDEEQTFFSDNADELTYFDVASMGKVLVTSTLILQAIDSGFLTLENTLNEFFDDVPDEKKNITIKHLLTHTSGIVRHILTPQSVDSGHDGIAEEILSHPLKFEPGSDYIYSCNGSILLGFILEKLYKKSLEEIYDEKIAKPLGLRRTAFEIDFDEPNSAVCYRWIRDENMPKRFDDENIQIMGESAGSGGQQSCLHDISKFAKAVLDKDKKLYSVDLFDIAEKNYTPDYSQGRGLGYLVVDEKYSQTGKLFPVGSFGHCGHAGQSFFINREKNLYVVILTNATRHANMKNEFKGYDYNDIMKMREEIHNAIFKDLFDEDDIHV
ncbi:MAG: beta-lactamase family protein [Clostridia bacterium]|nr:beta-lactamase family protein [Clostridia bacterium]